MPEPDSRVARKMGGVMSKLVLGVAAGVLSQASAGPLELHAGTSMHRDFGPTSVQEATIALRRGESADIAITQHGIDVVVRMRSPNGTLLDEIDSPNGRNGDEPVSIRARTSGIYRIHVQPFSASEPQGSIDVRVTALRSVAQTAQIARQRTELRRAAADWLRQNDAAIPRISAIEAETSIPPLDRLAADARVVGLGEATHGSVELNDVRLALVKRLVERHGFRLIALEDSVARWRALEPYVAGSTARPALPTEWGWIGRRARNQLLEWARSWNLSHPNDRVRLIGTDPQDNPYWKQQLPPLIEHAYGQDVAKAWQSHQAELAAADEQTQVFGDSSVASATRDFVQSMLARIVVDAPILRKRLGDSDYGLALDMVGQLAAFADFNSGGTLSKSRDWYMALSVLNAIGPDSKAIYWGHNAHVSASGSETVGALLRGSLGCGYRALATSFGSGGFLAQLPNDPTDRLRSHAVSTSDEESIESVLAQVRSGMHVAAWTCGQKPDRPAWLADLHKMRWVGGIYAPDSAVSASYRPYRLTDSFDAVVYVPVVRAEADPGDRPLVPARKR